MSVIKTLTFKIFGKTTSNDPEAKERGIRQEGHYDWRDPDRYLELGGTKVYSRDTAFNTHTGSVEPDWDLGWYVMDQRTNKILMEFKGPCPSPFRESLLEGRELEGIIIARDVQTHN